MEAAAAGQSTVGICDSTSANAVWIAFEWCGQCDRRLLWACCRSMDRWTGAEIEQSRGTAAQTSAALAFLF